MDFWCFFFVLMRLYVMVLYVYPKEFVLYVLRETCVKLVIFFYVYLIVVKEFLDKLVRENILFYENQWLFVCFGLPWVLNCGILYKLVDNNY